MTIAKSKHQRLQTLLSVPLMSHLSWKCLVGGLSLHDGLLEAGVALLVQER